MAEPVSTWVQEILERGPAAIATLGDEIVDAALAVLVAGVPVLHGRVFDLGIVERDELDHGGVKLILVAHGRGAAFEIAHISALVGDDQGALELAGLLRIDAEIGGQLHRAAHAGRHIDEGAVGKHRRVERRVEIVGDRHDRAEIFLHQLGMRPDRLGHRAEDDARLGQLLLEGGDHRDASRTRHRPRRAAFDPRAFDAGEHGLLLQRDAELGIGLEQLGIDVGEALGPFGALRRGVVIEVLEVDFRIVDVRPGRLLHGQPAAIGLEPPGEQPVGLVLLGRDEADHVLGQALGGRDRTRYR